MKTVQYQDLKNQFKRVLLSMDFTEEKAEKCATIFADNSRDGINSHGINRFSVFVKDVQKGNVQPNAELTLIEKNGVLENWDAHFGPGMYNASKAMQRAIEISKENGVGVVVLKNTNHWMRGGTYGWQAAEQGCVGICFTNTIACMPPWGGSVPKLGNNPLVIAVPRKDGHVVLDMAMSRYSYGKLQEYQFKGEQLPFDGGYDEDGNLTKDPYSIRKSLRPLPIGYWKGSSLSLVLDVLLTALSGGNSTKKITEKMADTGITQCFIAIHGSNYHDVLINEILNYTQEENADIRYPGEHILAQRKKSEEEGILVDERKWEQLLAM